MKTFVYALGIEAVGLFLLIVFIGAVRSARTKADKEAAWKLLISVVVVLLVVGIYIVLEILEARDVSAGLRPKLGRV